MASAAILSRDVSKQTHRPIVPVDLRGAKAEEEEEAIFLLEHGEGAVFDLFYRENKYMGKATFAGLTEGEKEGSSHGKTGSCPLQDDIVHFD